MQFLRLRQLVLCSALFISGAYAGDHDARVNQLRALGERREVALGLGQTGAAIAPAGGSITGAGGGGGSGGGSPTGQGGNPTGNGQTPNNGQQGQGVQGNNAINQALEKAQASMNDGLKKLQDAAGQIADDNGLQDLVNAAKTLGGVATGAGSAIGNITDQMVASLESIGQSRQQLATIVSANFAPPVNTQNYQTQQATNNQVAASTPNRANGSPVANAMAQSTPQGDPLNRLSTQLPSSLGLTGEQHSQSGAYNPPSFR